MISSYGNTLWYLLATEFKIFKRTIGGKFLDLFAWISTNIFVYSYLMPSFGLEGAYGTFIACGLFASAGLFEQFSSAVNLVNDFEGNQIISYYLTLPIPSWMVFLRSMIFFAFNTAVLSILVLPVVKIIAWPHVDLSNINIIQFLAIFFAFNLFYAAFTVWLASMTSSMERIGNVWMRFIYPLWYLGGFQFSYQVLYDYWPMLAYFQLLNPMSYILEGTRIAILGKPGLINFWVCVLMTIISAFIFGAYSVLRLKKRLDFI